MHSLARACEPESFLAQALEHSLRFPLPFQREAEAVLAHERRERREEGGGASGRRFARTGSLPSAARLSLKRQRP